MGLTIVALAVALSSLGVACLGRENGPPAATAAFARHAFPLAGAITSPPSGLGALGVQIMAVSLFVSVLLSFVIARTLDRRIRERTAALHEANRRLEALAHRDELTQLYNRRYFDGALAAEWQRARRERESISLVLCDVDHFKGYNDAYGHQAGDDCLRQVAEVIQQCLKRPADLAARYGGEEFVIVLPNTDLAGAVTVAEQIRVSLESRGLRHDASLTAPFVTLSLGVTSAVPEAGRDWRDLIAGADRSLYRSKREGRNRVSAAQSLRPCVLP